MLLLVHANICLHAAPSMLFGTSALHHTENVFNLVVRMYIRSVSALHTYAYKDRKLDGRVSGD